MPQPQAYDPTAAQPYVPDQQPDNIKPPMQSPFGGQPAPSLENSGRISRGGAAAGLFDGILRGAVNGYAMGEAHKALTLKKKSDDLQASYNADAQRAYQVAQRQIATNGKLDPEDPEYKAAKAAVDGSWGALHDFRGQLLEQQMGKSKGKKDAKRSPMEIMVDPKSTPQEKAHVLWEMNAKFGPEVYHQIQSMQAQAQSAQGKQQRDTAETGAQVQNVGAHNELTQQQLIQRRDVLLSKPTNQRTPAEVSELQQIEQRMPSAARQAGKENVQWLKDDKGVQHAYELKDGKFVPVEGAEGMQPSPKGAAGKPIRAFIVKNGKPTSVEIDPSTNQEIPGTENANIVPPSSMLQHVTTGQYIYTDPATGNIVKVPTSHSSTPVLPRGEPGAMADNPSSGAAPSGTSHPGHASSSGHPPASNVIGHKGDKPATKEDFAKLEKSTSDEYGKAHAAYVKAIEDVEASGAKGNVAGAARKRAADTLATENKRIGESHSQQMRALGGDPGDGSHQAAPAPAAQPVQSAQPHQQASSSKPRKIYQHGRLMGSMDMTDQEVKNLSADPDFTAKGGSIK